MKDNLHQLWINFYKRTIILLSSSRLAIPTLIAIFIGISTSFIGVAFIKCIEIIQDLFFGTGKEVLSFLGDYYIILIPAIGGLIVGPIVTFLAPEAKGHGVPQVMKAIAINKGKIRPLVVVAKAIASAFAIGSGASVGREGPIVQVGSAFGSGIAQVFKLSESKVRNYIACGAAAGIAAVFNAPIAGVMFSLEVILHDFGARVLSTVVVAAVSSSIVSRIFLGESPAFIAPVYSMQSSYEIFLYLILGILSALVALTFIKILSTFEDLADNWKFPNWLKPCIGGLAVGIIGFFFPQVFGSGLGTIENALLGGFTLKLLLLLVVIKILATSLALASGTSGGVFAPALFIGAVFGGAFGKFVYTLDLPFDIAGPGAYAIAGMASVFAGAAHAPVTAILIVFEMTGDYQMILPIMVAVVTATSIAQLLQRESIYTIKLKQKGIDIGAVEEAKFLGAIQVRDAMTNKFTTVSCNMPAKELISRLSDEGDKTIFVLNQADELMGAIKSDKVQQSLFEKDCSGLTALDVTSKTSEICFPDDPLNEASVLMLSLNLTEMPVVEPSNPKKVIGVLKTEDVFRAYTNITTKRDDLVSRAETLSSSLTGTIQVRFSILASSTLVSKQIKEVNVPDGVVLTSIQRKKQTLIPEGDTILQPRDKVWAMVIPEKKDEFEEWLIANKVRVSSFFGN